MVPVQPHRFGDRTFVNPVVPVGGVDRVVQPDVDAVQVPGGVSVYDPSTNLLVPGISRASVSSAGTAAVQLNFQDADGNAATLPGGRLYFVVYRPDFSVGPNNDYTRKDDAVETFLTAMNNIYETQTFPTMRDAVRSYWQSGWQIRYPTRATVAMGGIVSIVAQLALPGQRFDQNGNVLTMALILPSPTPVLIRTSKALLPPLVKFVYGILRIILTALRGS